MTDFLRVGVHDPGHDLGVGADIGGGNVLVRPQQDGDLAGVAAGQPLQFSRTHLAGVADDAALGPTERDADHGALDAHPEGERADLVEIGLGVVANPALGRGRA